MDRIFANTMIYFRKRAHLTQSELAIRTGITQSAISKLEDGAYWPNKITISKFCEAVGISGNEFFLMMAIQLFVLVFTQEIWLDDDDDEENEVVDEND